MKNFKGISLLVIIAGFTLAGAGCERETPVQPRVEEERSTPLPQDRTAPGTSGMESDRPATPGTAPGTQTYPETTPRTQ